MRQLRIENRQAPKAYFRGLNFLLNEQQDQAIDAFIEAVQNDPDTSELHFALGNLFRRRGEYERAVRVHEHLLSRADLSPADRHRAQHALALDFLKAGLLDRAEAALRRLEGTAFEAEAGLALLAIYERSRDWAPADEIAQKLEASGQGDFRVRRAHYLCEQAEHADAPQSLVLLRQALALGSDSARPGILLAQRLFDQGEAAAACDILLQTADKVPSALPLLAMPLARAAQACGRIAPAQALLQTGYDLVTGLGSLDVNAFLTAASVTALPATTSTLTAQPATITTAQTVVFTDIVSTSATSGAPPRARASPGNCPGAACCRPT